MDRIARRDPHKLDHKMTRDELDRSRAVARLARYFTDTQAPAFTRRQHRHTGLLQGCQWTGGSDAESTTCKTYLRWRVIRWAAPRLSTAFVEENFRFNGKYMRGAKEQKRWKVCVRAVDRDLGEAAGACSSSATSGPKASRRCESS